MADVISIKKSGHELKIFKTELRSYCLGLNCNKSLRRICSEQSQEIACNALFDLLAGVNR